MNDPTPSDASSRLLVTLVDNSGVIRAKLLPAARVAAAITKGIGLSPSFAGMCVDDHITPVHDSMAVGDMRLVPDLRARRRLSADLDWAPVDQLDQELQAMPTCPRSAARRLQDAAADRGYEYRMAFEFEFSVLRPRADAPDQYELAHDGPAYGVTPFLRLEPFLLDLEEALAAAGLTVEQVHIEYGNGQVEVSISPTDPVTAADNAVVTRIVASRVAQAHGMRTSFAPLTTAGGIGNGMHLHVSATVDGSNIFADGEERHGVTQAGARMISGLVRSLPDTVALYAPSVVSDDRLRPGMWSGAWVCWGPENREAGIRFIRGTAGQSQSSANCEIKVIEPSANPYLVVAAILAISQSALDTDEPLALPVDSDPGTLTTEEREALGIVELPPTAVERLDRLQNNVLLRKTLGDPLLDSFLAVHRYENDSLGSLDLEQRIETLRWRY